MEKQKGLDPETQHLANYLGKLVEKGASKGIDCGKMCHDCAFRKDQQPDQDYINAVHDATNQLAWDGRFNCHTSDKKDAKKPCAGFAYAKLGSIDNN